MPEPMLDIAEGVPRLPPMQARSQAGHPGHGRQSGLMARLRPCAMYLTAVIIAVGAILWLACAGSTCPSATGYVPADHHSHGNLAGRYTGATDMYQNAGAWLNYFARLVPEKGGVPPQLVYNVSHMNGGLKEEAARLKDKFTEAHHRGSNETKKLNASLRHGLSEAEFHRGATRYWWRRLACLRCGWLTASQSCPDHPIEIAIREAKKAKRLLSDNLEDHGKLMSLHSEVERRRLRPAYDLVCSNIDYAGRVRERQQGSFGSDDRSRELLGQIYSACSVMERDIFKATEFRERQMSRTIYELLPALSDITTTISDLEAVRLYSPWSSQNCGLGIRALEKLMGIISALGKAGD